MAITPLPNTEYGFIFNGEDSKTYGVYTTQGAFYSAPQRDVEKIDIPGRNGSYMLDRGRFLNIQVTYHCTILADDETEFINAIADVRAWLCSVKGYARLTDDFNPSEFRLASFINGIGVTNENPSVGTFDIVFDAMPQRFLTSGETAVAMTLTIDSITNPTRFPSRPMLEIEGYGETDINGWPVVINSQPIGTVICADAYSVGKSASSSNFIMAPNYSSLNVGDTVEIELGGQMQALVPDWAYPEVYTHSESGGLFDTPYISGNLIVLPFVSQTPRFSFSLGTAATATATVTVTAEFGGIIRHIDVSASLSVDTDGVLTFTISTSTSLPAQVTKVGLSYEGVRGDSTKSALGSPIYIDLDIGEAYKIENDEMISVNSAVELPAELPELSPGANEIVHENTITDLKIVPRWWTI